MPFFTNTLKKIDNAIAYFFQLPMRLLFIYAPVLAVLPIPLLHLSNPELYSNHEAASAFFKSLPFANNMLLVIHIAAALPAIIVGPLLFHTGFRKNWLPWHKRLGKFYVFGCWISAVSVLPLAMANYAGLVAYIGFGCMACLWLITTYFAYTAIRNKDPVAHRRWMMRSYAMTFAFVHVNLTYPLFLPYGLLTTGGIKAFQSMVSWLFNLMVVELYLDGTNTAGRFLGWKKWLKNIFKINKDDRFYFKP